MSDGAESEVSGGRMHPTEIESVLKTMRILVDTRERPTKQAEQRYSRFGIPYERKKLDFGDYSAVFTLPNGQEFSLENVVSIERKQNYDELCGCFTHERGRFQREFERAEKAGARIYLLVENASWEAAYAGKYRSMMKPQSLVASMLAWMARYDCRIVLCKPETSGKLIHDLLYREAKEALSRVDDG